MTDEAKTVIRYGRIYAAANLVGRSGGLILIPLYTHYLSIESYGVYTVLLAVTDLLALVFGMGISKGMGRLYFDHPEGSAARDAVVSTTLIGFLSIVLAIALAAYFIATAIVLVAFDDLTFVWLFTLAIGSVAFLILFEIELGYFVIKKKAKLFFFFSCAKAFFLLASNIYFLMIAGLGVYGVVYAQMLSFGVLALGSGTLILVSVGSKFEWKTFREILAFGLPLVPSAFANSAIRLLERYYLTSLGGVAAVAIYGFADRLASLLQMFIATPFSQIFFVRRFETMSSGDSQTELDEVLLLFVIVIALAGAGLSVFGHDLVAVLAPEAFASAAYIIPILVGGHILSAINLNIELGILYRKRTWIVPIIGMITLVSAVPANYVLISQFGIYGAGLAFLSVNVIRLCLTTIANVKWGTPEIRLDWLRAVPVLVMSATFGVVVTRTMTDGMDLASIAIKGLILVVAAGALLYSPLFPPKTRLTLRQVLMPRGRQ